MRIDPRAMRSVAEPSSELELGRTVEAPATEGTGAFGEVLVSAVKEANSAQKTASAQAEAVAKGAIDDLHGTMITMKEADISLKLVGSVRNKLLDAFHELWRINL